MSSSIWILDSGASHHMSYDHKSFLSLNSKPSMSVMTADGTLMPIAGIGQLCDSGYSVMFSSTHCYVQDPQSGRLIGTGRRHGGLYVLDELKVPDTAASTST
ncbi:gag-pol polyprotein, partial [Trifolium pratense]